MANSDNPGAPRAVDRETFEAQIEALRAREKAHTKAGDALNAARRRLPMVRVDGATRLTDAKGPTTLLEAFDERRMLIAYYFMWHAGKPASEQCEGCTFFTAQIRELSHFHSRDATYVTIAQGPYDESKRYRDFMGWTMPWYAADRAALETLLVGRKVGMMHLVCYLRQGEEVFETYWTTRRGVEVMDNTYHLLDLTVFGRQEKWEDSPPGWPQTNEGKTNMRIGERPIAQWPRMQAGVPDALK